MRTTVKPMRCLSLWQPWAYAMFRGWKGVETRLWDTSYRGLVAIHAAKNTTCLRAPGYLAALGRRAGVEWPHPAAFALGAIVAVGELVRCFRTDDMWPKTFSDRELALGDYSPGRYGWHFKNVRPLPVPVPYRAMQGLFTLPADVAERLMLDLTRVEGMA